MSSLFNNTYNYSVCCKNKLKLTESESLAFILKWATLVTSSGTDTEQNKINRALQISKFFSSNAILKGTVSRIFRTQTTSLPNYLDASGAPGTKLNAPPGTATSPAIPLNEQLNIFQYFTYFNGISIPGLTPHLDSRNSSFIQLTSNIVQYNAFVNFKQDSGGPTLALMTFILKKNSNGVIKIVSLNSSPVFQDFIPELSEPQLASKYFN